MVNNYCTKDPLQCQPLLQNYFYGYYFCGYHDAVFPCPKRKHTVRVNVSASARGTASHTPVTPKNFGNIKRKAIINPNVRKNEIIAETFPFDSAVNNAEEKILHPEKRKPKAKIVNPAFVIWNTFLLSPANIRAIFSPAKKENKNTQRETARIKEKPMRTIFLSCFVFLLP